jgi:hypothetical protein
MQRHYPAIRVSFVLNHYAVKIGLKPNRKIDSAAPAHKAINFAHQNNLLVKYQTWQGEAILRWVKL